MNIQCAGGVHGCLGGNQGTLSDWHGSLRRESGCSEYTNRAKRDRRKKRWTRFLDTVQVYGISNCITYRPRSLHHGLKCLLVYFVLRVFQAAKYIATNAWLASLTPCRFDAMTLLSPFQRQSKRLGPVAFLLGTNLKAHFSGMSHTSSDLYRILCAQISVILRICAEIKVL